MTYDDLIASYFFMDKEIRKCKRHVGKVRAKFYNQSMSSHVTSDETHVFSEGFNVESNVIQLVDTLAVTEDSRKVLEFKHKHFKRYLKALPESERVFLIDKYKNKSQATNGTVERACLKEIKEIEEAAGYRFNYYVQPELLNEISSISENLKENSCKPKHKTENFIESFEADHKEENFIESFQDDFAAMLKTLGVT